MAHGQQLESSQAHSRPSPAGSASPTLSYVNRRRAEIWGTSLVLVTTLVLAVTLLLGGESRTSALGLDRLSTWVLLVLVGGLAFAFLIYAVEKESSLRRIAHLLIEERVRSQTLSNRLAEMSRLSELGRAVNATLDLNSVLDHIVSYALDFLEGDEGSILLLGDDQDDELTLASYRGEVPPDELTSRISLASTFAGEVARSRSPLLVNDVAAHKLSQDPQEQRRRIASYMCVPLLRNDSLSGVLEIANAETTRAFTPEDLTALGFFAEHAVIALRNARTFERERETIAQLEELDHLKDDFVAMVSHELRSPLTAIMGAAKTIARKGPDMSTDQHEIFMDMIVRQADRMLRLSEDFLTAARMDSGMRKMRRELIDLSGVAERVIDDLKHARVGEERVVELAARPRHPEVWGDRAAIEQILSNLVENALKYSPPDAPVAVRVEATETEAKIEVADRGQGISPEQLGSIFDRYRQVEDDGGRKVGGVGLGLFIVKNLVDAHRGKIDVASELGAGATFTVCLPKRSKR
jgi:signal transduction histidine kinase